MDYLCLEGVGNTAVAGFGGVRGHAVFDFAESLLVLFHIVAQSEKEVLGVLGSHDDAALHFGLRHVGGHGDEVEEELVGRVSDYCEVGVVTGSHFRCELYFEFLFCVIIIPCI